MKTIMEKKVLIQVILLLIIWGLIFSLKIIKKNIYFEQQEYEIEYKVISDSVAYYDGINNNFLLFLKYRINKNRIIESFIERESVNKNEFLIHLKYIITQKDVRNFVKNIEYQIKWLFDIHDDFYTKNDDRFFIIVKHYNFFFNDEVFLYVVCKDKKSQCLKIID